MCLLSALKLSRKPYRNFLGAITVYLFCCFRAAKVSQNQETNQRESHPEVAYVIFQAQVELSIETDHHVRMAG